MPNITREEWAEIGSLVAEMADVTKHHCNAIQIAMGYESALRRIGALNKMREVYLAEHPLSDPGVDSKRNA